ncbi:MAG: hypothetical protein KGN35_01410 [Betaproteobacteria bacterium]|nr:hypothetical protein [Betaproteobacteria bacterium]
MKITRQFLVLSTTCILAACVSLPSGPSVMTLPGSGKSFEQFRHDDYDCRRYAYEQIGGLTPRQSAQSSGVQSAAVGAGLGAAAGAAIAGGGGGAAIGAGAGLLAGGLAGSGTASTSAYVNQHRYDMSYIQCMYAKGHRVPVSGKISGDAPAAASSTVPGPSSFNPPPLPPGNPPPPPPR